MKTQPGRAIAPVRWQALQLVFDIMENQAYANLALDKFLRKSALSAQERRQVTEMVNGTVRMAGHLDWVLNGFVKKGIEHQHPWLRNILRLSLYQILFMDAVPEFACVNDAVELTRKKVSPQMGSVTNAVLRNILRQRDRLHYPDNESDYLSVFYSHPPWLVDKFLELFGAQTTREILAYNNLRPRLTVRVNTLLTSRSELLEQMQAEGVKCCPGETLPVSIQVEQSPQPIYKLSTYQEGKFYVQQEAAMLAAFILNPQEGETVYDLASGVGGKSIHLAEQMKNRGQVQAFDLYEHKLRLLQENCRRMHIDIVTPREGNILQLSGLEAAQRVLLDAPCSGSGVLGHRADARWRKTEAEIGELHSLQVAMLAQAGDLLADNGYLLYSTCSILREENEEVIEQFLQERSDFTLQGFADRLAGFPLDEGDLNKARAGMLTLLPGKYDTDGMFFALLRRQEKA